MKQEALSFSHVSVDDYEFGGLLDVSFCLYSGETVVVDGLMNSGCITMMNLLSGKFSDYDGNIKVLGNDVRLDSYSAVRNSNIVFIGNIPQIFDNMSIYENVLISRPQANIFAMFDDNSINHDKHWIWDFLNVDPDTQSMDCLTRFQTTKLEIAKAIIGGARIIAFTMMSMYISESEAREIREIIPMLNERYITVLMESNDYFHIFEELVSRVIIFRNGVVAATLYEDENDIFDEEKIRHAIIGRSFDKRFTELHDTKNLPPYMSIEFNGGVIDLSRGTITGFYDARERIPQTIEGLIDHANKEFHVNVGGTPLVLNGVDALIQQGIAVISKESFVTPIFKNLSPEENVGFLAQQRFGRKYLYSRDLSTYFFNMVVNKYKILRKCKQLRHKKDCYGLPYERQFELMMAKWLAINPDIIVIFAPLGNKDTKNYERYRQLLNTLAGEDKVVLVISSSYDNLEDTCGQIYPI